jgi:hypothetical protein
MEERIQAEVAQRVAHATSRMKKRAVAVSPSSETRMRRDSHTEEERIQAEVAQRVAHATSRMNKRAVAVSPSYEKRMRRDSHTGSQDIPLARAISTGTALATARAIPTASAIPTARATPSELLEVVKGAPAPRRSPRRSPRKSSRWSPSSDVSSDVSPMSHLVINAHRELLYAAHDEEAEQISRLAALNETRRRAESKLKYAERMRLGSRGWRHRVRPALQHARTPPLPALALCPPTFENTGIDRRESIRSELKRTQSVFLVHVWCCFFVRPSLIPLWQAISNWVRACKSHSQEQNPKTKNIMLMQTTVFFNTKASVFLNTTQQMFLLTIRASGPARSAAKIFWVGRVRPTDRCNILQSMW